MDLLDKYEDARQAVFDYFGYKEVHVVIPLDDATQYFWRIYGEGPGSVRFAETEESLNGQEGDCYVNEIYTQRFLKKWVYRGAAYTMICVKTNVDGNKFLQIFDNTKERPVCESGF